MKILFAATVDIHIINHHLRIIHALHEAGHRVDVAANGDYTNADITRKYNICFSKNPLSTDNLKAEREMKRILREEDYDIISCHTPLSSYFVRLAARGTRAKVIYTAHGFHFYKGCPLINRTIYKTMEAHAAHFTDTLVTINLEDYEAACRFRLKKGGQVKLIPGVGIDLAKIHDQAASKEEVRRMLGIPEDAFVCISVGEVNKNKNQLTVIEALAEDFKQNDKLYYVICGRGPLEDTVHQRIAELGLEKRILLLGYREDAVKLLYGCDLFFSPSYREGLPVSVMEAMAAGVPVVASNVRGNRDLIEDGKSGMLYEPDDRETLGRIFRKLYGDASLREKTAETARMEVRKYAKEAIDPQILELYE